MTQFLDRYLAGEHKLVWLELWSLGERASSPEYFDDAWAVALETMKRVRANVEVITSKLRAQGYEFGDPRNVGDYMAAQPHTPPTEYAVDLLRWLENLCGPLPLTLKAWVTVVGDVTFLGQHPTCA